MIKPKDFTGRVVILGCGTIGQCAVPMLLDVLALPPSRLTVIDALDRRASLPEALRKSITFLQRRITPDTLGEVMHAALQRGDLLLNLSVGIDSIALADWCQARGVLYVDTAIEPWEDFVWDPSLPPHERTEYALHQSVRRKAERCWNPAGPTTVFAHGANPGLVSHFLKAGLVELAAATNLDAAAPTTPEGWARLARQTGTTVIHISERDTQISHRPRRPGEFVNTWSIEGFLEEAVMPGEIGWGTHEKTLPPLAREQPHGPGNAVYITKPAAEVRLRSWVPSSGPIAGLALPHSEAITISDYLTLTENGAVVYRPTVVFVYLPCDAAMASLHEAMMAGWQPQDRNRIMTSEIAEGCDELGVLLLGDGPTGWWYGSRLDIQEARRLFPNSNATAVQVAAGAVAAAYWATKNPRQGFCEPEALPHDEILETARPYLGRLGGVPAEWTPLQGRQELFEEPWVNRDDPWQFVNFVMR